MQGLRIAVISDGGHVQQFARDALDAIVGCSAITEFACTNSRWRKRPFRHGLYYALNLLAVRNPLSRGVPLAGGTKRIEETVAFESDYDGAWQVLPPQIIERLRTGGFGVILKFGMGLLRVPPQDVLPVPILSYHHGDPDLYRGRPAGFWEIAEGRRTMGQIVQVIGNKLDAGRVVAFAETKVHPHSYRATLMEAFRHSPLIINEAIRNARAGNYLAKPCTGRNYRLPGNLQVAGFLARNARKSAGRVAYGAAFEKKWRVSRAAAPAGGAAALFAGASLPPEADWRTPEPGRRYSFYADPFFSAEPDGILVEALNRRTGLGEIVLVEGDRHRLVSDFPGHASYPFTFNEGGTQLVVPETASCLPVAAFRLDQDRLQPAFNLRAEGATELVDPTLVRHEGRLYLFAGVRSLGSNALFLWSADALHGEFRQHPLNPVKVSPRGGRMGGSFIRDGGRLIRLGQDGSAGYGDGLIAFEVLKLSDEDYEEREIGRFAFADRKGPHTLNERDGELLFDWYRERFAPGAGVRRFAARRRQRA